MSFEIKISYAPLTPKRRGHTQAIMSALRTMKATPKDDEGNPASFVLPAKHRHAVRVASADTGIKVRTRIEGESIRVLLASAPSAADQTAPLPGIE